MQKQIIVWANIGWMAAITLAHFVINSPYYLDKVSTFTRFLFRV